MGQEFQTANTKYVYVGLALPSLCTQHVLEGTGSFRYFRISEMDEMIYVFLRKATAD